MAGHSPDPSHAENAAKEAIQRRYERVAQLSRAGYFPFMNYGYVLSKDEVPLPALVPEDKPWRLCLQMYHHLTTRLSWEGKDVLEVGSGHGGGSYYTRRYLGARSVVGLDLSPANTAYSREIFDYPGLKFQCGDAESIPFPAASFDVVLNVESAHGYPNMRKFFREAHRIQRVDGFFLFADHIPSDWQLELPLWLDASGIEVLECEDISTRVLAAADIDNERKRRILRELPLDPQELQAMNDFVTLVGTPSYNALKNGEEVYVSILGRKK